ncbi:MAG: signal peptidase II [Elusimicrobiota bacterium]
MLKWQKLIIVIVALLDQFTKYLVRGNFNLYESHPVFSFLSITYVQNTGVAFGVLQHGKLSNIIFIIISVTIIAVIARYKNFFESHGKKGAMTGIPLVFGGAIGNLIDRVMLGSVVDFIDFHFFPVFNLADSCITIGAVVLLLSVIFVRKLQ